MVDKELSTIEVRLLLVKYGYAQVIQTLAKIRDDSVEKIEEDIRKLDLSRKNKSKPHTTPIDDMVSRLIRDNHTKASELQALAIRYENKTFLPQLRDVKRFLDRYSANPRVLKSREFAASQVFTTLASLDISQLQEYLMTPETNTVNALSILSDQIIGNRHK